jgi:hypothetical protein
VTQPSSLGAEERQRTGQHRQPGHIRTCCTRTQYTPRCRPWRVPKASDVRCHPTKRDALVTEAAQQRRAFMTGGRTDGSCSVSRSLCVSRFAKQQRRGVAAGRAQHTQHTSSCSTTSHSASLVCRACGRRACGLSTSTKPSSPSVAVGSSSSPEQTRPTSSRLSLSSPHTHQHSTTYCPQVMPSPPGGKVFFS